MRRAISTVGAVALILLAAPASAFSGPCYGEAMRCRQDGLKRQTMQQDLGASAREATHPQPRRTKDRRRRAR